MTFLFQNTGKTLLKLLNIPCSLVPLKLIAYCLLQLTACNFSISPATASVLFSDCSSLCTVKLPAMNSIFGSTLFKPAKAVEANSIFHGDQSLHDQRPITRGWFDSASLRSDLPAALRLLRAHFQGKDAEEAVAQCAALPVDDPLRKVLTATSVSKLWGSLLHPPLSYRGGLFAYRTADGSANVRQFRGPT